MSIAVHPMGIEPDAADLQFAIEQFRIHSFWTMVATSIVASISCIIWLMLDLFFLLGGMSGIWSGDITLSQKLGAALLWTLFIAAHCVGGSATITQPFPLSEVQRR